MIITADVNKPINRAKYEENNQRILSLVFTTIPMPYGHIRPFGSVIDFWPTSFYLFGLMDPPRPNPILRTRSSFQKQFGNPATKTRSLNILNNICK